MGNWQVTPVSIRDPGTGEAAGVASGGHILTAPVPWGVAVACGMVKGWGSMEKFGHCADNDTGTVPADMWQGAAAGVVGNPIYDWTETAQAYYISSTDAGDTVDMLLVGLTEDASGNWNEETVTVTLAGQTKTAIPSNSGDPWIRMYRTINVGTVNIAGIVYVYEDDTVVAGVPQTAAKVRVVVDDGDNQTEMCIYTVPDSIIAPYSGEREVVQCGVFAGGYVGIARSSAVAQVAEFTWRARPPGGVFAVKGRTECQNRGDGSWQYKYPTDGVAVPPKTDIVIRTELVSANNTSTVGGFGVWLRTEAADE